MTLHDTHINLSHGSGGRAMRALIEDVFHAAFGPPPSGTAEDSATLPLTALLRHGDRLAFTTDSYVVDPLFFPGADIGALAVAGTVNDLAVSGARPMLLSCSMVIEEGLPVDTLRRVTASMRAMADRAGVAIVTGDTKVVEHGAADKLFINTSGIGAVPAGTAVSAANARPGDAVIVSGTLGDHGTAILIARNLLALDADVASDCQPLHALAAAILRACPATRCLRDATRGGVAAVLNEFASASRAGIRIREAALPIRQEVRGACEILGLDPLYLANEGKLVAVVPGADAGRVVAAMRADPAGRDAAIIGEVVQEQAGLVVMQTGFGGDRVVDMLTGEPLPRICWMHELGIASAIVEACAARAAGARILRIRVEVGALTAVLPDALRFCFDACAHGTAAEGAVLEILDVPGRAVCDACGGTVMLSSPFGRCDCGGTLRILAGEELRVKDMEIA